MLIFGNDISKSFGVKPMQNDFNELNFTSTEILYNCDRYSIALEVLLRMAP